MQSVRADFPILHKPLSRGMLPVYLDSAASAQKPRQVLDKLLDCYENYYANAYRGVYEFGARVDDEMEASRRKIQAFIGAHEPEEIIFTSGTTMSINLVAAAWGRKFLQPGDEVLVNAMEHHANIVPWQRVTAERGATLRFLPITPAAQLDVSQLDEFISNKTKLVAVTGMSNVFGTIPPIDVIAAKAKRHSALLLVDGAQSVPHALTNVQDPAIDFLAFSGHKLFGPTGVGVLYGRRELLEAMDPFLTGGHMIDRVACESSTWAPIPAKFEAGTIPIAQAIALGAAVDYVNAIGFDAVHAYEQRLLEYAHERLAAIPGLRILGPDVKQKGAIVTFTIEGAAPEDIAQLLNRRGIFVRHGHHCTMPLHDLLGVAASTRASFSIYNTQAEVDELYEGLQFVRERLRLA